MFRGEGGNGVVVEERAAGIYRIPDAEIIISRQANDVARVGIVHHLAVVGEKLVGAGQPQLPRRARVMNRHITFKAPTAYAHKGDTIAVAWIHVRLNFEDKAGKVWSGGWNRTHIAMIRTGRGSILDEVVEEQPHAKVGEGAAKVNGRLPSSPHLRQIKGRHLIQQTDIGKQVVQTRIAQTPAHTRIVERRDRLWRNGLVAHRAVKEVHLRGEAVIDAEEALAVADGPVHGYGLHSQDVFYFIKQS